MSGMTGVVVGGIAAGGVAGAIKGAQGTPAQTTTTSTTLGPVSRDLQQMRDMSLKNYFAQNQLANDYQGGINNAQGMQDASRAFAQRMLDGSAYQATPEEQAQMQAIREASVNQGQTDIMKLLQQGMSGINQNAGMRGLRGQAVSELQGRNLQAQADSMTGLVNNANSVYAQQMLSQPMARVNSQANMAGMGMSLADQLRNQAQQNLQLAQNPVMLQLLQNERLATATQKGFTPGQKGSFGSALVGGLTGGLGGAQVGANIYGAGQNLGAWGGSPTAASPGNFSASRPVWNGNLGSPIKLG